MTVNTSAESNGANKRQHQNQRTLPSILLPHPPRYTYDHGNRPIDSFWAILVIPSLHNAQEVARIASKRWHKTDCLDGIPPSYKEID